MSISLACPSCGTTVKAPDKSAGRRAPCPRCHVLIAVPGTAPPAGRTGDLPVQLLLNNPFAREAGRATTALVAIVALVVGLTLGAVGGFLVGHTMGGDEQRKPLAQAKAEEAPRPEPAKKEESEKKTAKVDEPKPEPTQVNKSDQGEAKQPPTAPSSEKLSQPTTPPVQTAPAAPRVETLPKAGTGAVPPITQDDRDRAALFEFVNKHAQNPANLEILDLGQGPNPSSVSRGYPYIRKVAFRCDLIDYTPDKEYRGGEGGYRKLEPRPLSRESGTAHFTADGKVDRIFLDGCQCLWGTRRPGDPGFVSPDRP
jgi:hypothetical protein